MNWLSTTHIDSGEQLQEYINTFKLNIVHTKYDELKDAATLISYFSAGVPTWIMHHIQAMDTVLTTLTLWYEKATHFRLQKRSPERSPSCTAETAPNGPALIKVFAQRTPVPLVTQMPWILMRLTYPPSSIAGAFEATSVLSANSQTVLLGTIPETEQPLGKLSPPIPLETRNKYKPPRHQRRGI